ncbi:aminopeptidase N-like protein [Asbolus verrucosus]|uniref:Aminopeptidase N n=1 Tax=Asbolus verrucosus TaxID=1661398 RepID=A0A482W9F5_ASBVE|nr:aminopeptidase N-like protein [Asbolus verrucosus]
MNNIPFYLNILYIPTLILNSVSSSVTDLITVGGEYRLPVDIIPFHYVVDLNLEENTFVTNTFSGAVSISLEVVNSVNKIKLHYKDITIKTLNLKTNRNLSETSMHGFYKSSYEENGTINYLATTHFEAAHAREAFPCFDEPGFKATFDITITFPEGFNGLSNTKTVNQENIYGLGSPVTNLPNDQYRLPNDVLPVHYILDLKLQEDVFLTNTFFGTVIIGLDVINPINEIKLHYSELTIKTLILNSGNRIINTLYSYDSITQILTILSENLNTRNNYNLTISYEGVLSETAMNGFYKSSYEENGTVSYLATTHFEATHARKAFPCFDEPVFKASFDISITFPQGFNALANTKIAKQEIIDDNLQRVTFQTTPKMSTYLLAFIISKFTCTEGNPVDQIPTSVCSRKGTQNSADLAVSVAPKVLEVMEGYTDYKYGSSNITKLTQVAIPDFAAGAMENWGLVTFRETSLLWDEEESSNIYQESVVNVVAHELSHQWFGDLVTLDWWSNIFLNEGFATYFGYYVTDQIYPQWEFAKQFVIEQLQIALLADSMQTSLPLSYYVETPDKISERFDDISYNKGGSILRMVHYFLGIENFKSGLRDYISNNKFLNANPTILWNSFEKYAEQLPQPQKLPDKMTVVMENWTNKSGYPLLTVNSNGSDVIISQEQFLYSGSTDTKWYVPISYTVSNENFSDTATKAWLTPSEDLIIFDVLSNQSNANWIILNNQQTGFYRINYNDELWRKISESLLNPEFDGIDVMNRGQIVDDLLNLARANKKNYSDVFDLLSFLKNDEAYYPWYSAFNGFSYVLQRTGDKNLITSLSDYVSGLMQQLYASTPFNIEQPDDHVYTRRQILGLTWACSLGIEDCITNSKTLFANYRDQSIKPSRNLKSIIYCNGLRYSENVAEDFNFLWTKYSESQISTEKVTILKALGCIKNRDVLNEYLQRVITDGSGIRIQDASSVFSAIYSSNVEGIDIVFDFVINNYKDIVAHFGSTRSLNSVISSVADRFTNQEQIEKLKNFASNDEVDESVRTAATEALKTAETNLETTRYLEAQLRDYFGSQLI